MLVRRVAVNTFDCKPYFTSLRLSELFNYEGRTPFGTPLAHAAKPPGGGEEGVSSANATRVCSALLPLAWWRTQHPGLPCGWVVGKREKEKE